MKRSEDELRSIVNQVFTRDKFLLFLRILAMNPNLSLENLLFVFEQKPEAKQVCGKKAWHHLGREVKEDSTGIRISVPKYLSSDEESEAFREIEVFDLNSTSGKAIDLHLKEISIGAAITKATGITWEVTPTLSVNGFGYYDNENRVFLLSKECKGDLVAKTELEVFVDYRFGEMEIENSTLKMAILYTLMIRYELKHKLSIVLYGKLWRLSQKDKYDFLHLLVFVVWEIVQAIEGIQLSFQESILLNYYLESNDLQRLKEMSTVYKEWGLEQLIAKLENTSVEVIEELLKRRQNRRLFTFPPCNLEELLLERSTRI